MTSNLGPCIILLTGATGFVGKVVLQELLRRDAEFRLSRIVLVIRPKEGRDRFRDDIANSLCFSRLEPGWENKIEVVLGDLTMPRLGMDNATYERLATEISHLIHCAGCIKFDLPIKEASSANITSNLNILELAKASPKLRRFVSTSTAYVTPHRLGPIGEVLFNLPANAMEIYEKINTGQIPEKELLTLTGHPNTYTLTKCLAEHLLVQQRGIVPLSIVRPSVIGASWKYPFPGWIDSMAAMAAAVAPLGCGLLHVLDGDPSVIIDMVPVDQVAERILHEAFIDINLVAPETRIIYSVATFDNGSIVHKTITGIKSYFGPNGLMGSPKLNYLGPRNFRFAFEDMIRHTIPTAIVKSCLTVLQNKKELRQVNRYTNIVKTVNDVFPYFLHNSFDFRPSFMLPQEFDIESYQQKMFHGIQKNLLQRDSREAPLGGSRCKKFQGGIKWASRKPESNLAIRTAGVILRNAFRGMFDLVTFDQHSFDCATQELDKNRLLVLVPTHRSYVDFLVCSFLFFSRPDLGIKVPYIAAAHEFSEIPLLGRLFRELQAFYVKRGQGIADPAISSQIGSLVESGESLLFFPEGQRSRSRLFLPPRRGILRALQETGKSITVLPISITYDRVAEERSFLKELKGGARKKMKLRSLAKWICRMKLGRINLGRMHISCGAALSLDQEMDIHAFTKRLMHQLQANTATSTFHTRCFTIHHQGCGINPQWLQDQIEKRGGTVIKSSLSDKEASGIDPYMIRCFQNHWAHLFFKEARGYQPNNPALRHYIRENSFVESPDRDNRENDRAFGTPESHIEMLLTCMFEPVCTEYITLASTVRGHLGKPDSVPRESLLACNHDYTIAESALRCLVEQKMVVSDGGQYIATASRSELDSFIDDCSWPTSRASTINSKEMVR